MKQSVCVLTFFFLPLICLDGLLEKKKNQIIGKLNGGVAVTMGSITDWSLRLLAYGWQGQYRSEPKGADAANRAQ